MDFGIFIPIGNNGWLMSEHAPQYMPSFQLNRSIASKAERYGFKFLLSMIKLRGFGGRTEFWDHNLESFTLMAGLAAVTSEIQLYASVALPTIPPAIVARMATTIDDISDGRFGVNIVSGWNRTEYSQMGIWPGDWYFDKRYEYASEYVSILRELWSTGVSNFSGKYFQLEDCRLSPRPRSGSVPIICAGQSDTGLEFCAKHGDFQFIGGSDDVEVTAAHAARMQKFARLSGRDVGPYALYFVITGNSDAEAERKWAGYKDGADLEAIANLARQAQADSSGGTSTAMIDPKSAFAMNIGKVVGSHASVAKKLDEIGAIPGMKGIMCIFDDYETGIDDFGRKVMPLLKA